MNYYQRLKDLREDHDLTQAQIAKILCIEQTAYSRYELGKHMMGIDKYIILAKYYNVSLDYICGLTNTPRDTEGGPYKITPNQKNTTNINISGNGTKINIKQ